MRAFSILGSAVLVAVGVVVCMAVAKSPDARTTFTAKVRVSPSKAGTPERPRGVKVSWSMRFSTPEGIEEPAITRGSGFLPRGTRYNAGLLPRCSQKTLDREGPGGCPKRSRIGGGHSSMYADALRVEAKVQIFNGGPKVAYTYATLFDPPLVTISIPARIKRLSRGRWAYRIAVKTPPGLRIVGGIPVITRSVEGWIGRGNLIATTSCPKSRRWTYKIKTDFAGGEPYAAVRSVPCRPAG